MKNSFILQLPVELAIAELCLEKSSLTKPAANISLEKSVSVQRSAAPAETGKSSATVPAADLTAGSIPDREKILSRWSEVLAKIKKYNHSLSFILHQCLPRDLAGNRLCLAFKYKFHKDRINEAKMKEIVQNVLREVYGAPLLVDAVIDENMEVAEPANKGGGVETNLELEIPVEESLPGNAGEEKDMMSDLLKTFGGKIVG